MAAFEAISFGKYLLLDRIAVGGMAELYRARITGEQGFEKLIAIKKLLFHLTEEEELVNAFIEEAKLAALLQHQNIAQIYDFGNMEGDYFIAMELLFGKDLRLMLNKSKEENLPLDLEYALYISSRICAGLDYAHNMKDMEGRPLNIIHRDISPQNIFITYDGEVKILDFGIAKAGGKNTTTAEGVIKGKVAYMSPEQAGGGEIDQRSDIFSTGVILYELVTGKKMFEGDPLQILHQVREADMTPPQKVTDDLPPGLDGILKSALVKDPNKRYKTSGDMLSELEECMRQNDFRPTDRGLAKYMRDLFQEEIAAEEGSLRKLAQIQMVEPSKGEKETPFPSDTHEKTDILPPEELPGTRKGARLRYGAVAVTLLAVISVVFGFLLRSETNSKAEREGTKVVSLQRKTNPLEQGMVALNEERFAEAVSFFEAHLAGEPDDKDKVAAPYAQALVGQGASVAKKNPRKARSLLQRAIEYDPRNVRAHFQLAQIHVRVKDYPKAVAAYREAAALDPQFPETFFNLAYVYALTKDYSKAEKMYGRVVKLAPPYLDEALFNLAIVQEKQGKRAQSIKNLERALQINPKNETAKKFLSKLR